MELVSGVVLRLMQSPCHRLLSAGTQAWGTRSGCCSLLLRARWWWGWAELVIVLWHVLFLLHSKILLFLALNLIDCKLITLTYIRTNVRFLHIYLLVCFVC